MFKKWFYSTVLLLTLISLVGYGVAQDIEKKVVMIIASDNFRDEELFVTKTKLEEEAIKVTIASSTLQPVKGMLGSLVQPGILNKDINMEDYSALILVGGMGARQYWDDQNVHTLIKQAQASGKVIGAICLAPVILARAGILAGKQATVSVGYAEELKEKKSIYVSGDLIVSGNIITADGPGASAKFGQAIAQAVKGSLE